MQLEHELTVPLDVEATWALIRDIERVATCFPGAALDSFDGSVFQGNVSVKLGPIAMKYQGAGEFVKLDAAKYIATIDAKGTEVNGSGSAGAMVNLTLHPSGRSVTKVSIQTDLAITGKPAQFGRGVISDVSDNLLKQFAANLEAQLEGGPDAQPAAVGDLNMLAAVWRPIAQRAIPVAGVALLAVVVLSRFRRSRRAHRPATPSR